MKTVSATVAVFLTLSGAAFAAEQTVTLAVDKMFCALCPVTVSKAMQSVAGVSDVAVDFKAKLAVATYDDAVTNWQEIALASTNAGYPASRVEAAE